MLRRFLLTSGLILGGAIAYSPKVVAQDVNVPFTANIDTACQVQSIEPGTLVQSSDYSGILSSMSSGGGPVSPEQGRVELVCNTPAELEITGVTAISTPEPDPAGTEFFVEAEGNNGFTNYLSNGPEGSPLPLDSGSQGVDVRMEVNRDIAGGSFSAGLYEYEVNMTVTPQ
jgi:hypothetical protein